MARLAERIDSGKSAYHNQSHKDGVTINMKCAELSAMERELDEQQQRLAESREPSDQLLKCERREQEDGSSSEA